MRYKQTSRRKTWYECTTENTIKADPEALYIKNFETSNLSGVLRCLHECRYSHSSIHNGYINQKDLALLPYTGRFGKGWIMVQHLSSFKVQYYYYLLQKEGKQHAKANSR